MADEEKKETPLDTELIPKLVEPACENEYKPSCREIANLFKFWDDLRSETLKSKFGSEYVLKEVVRKAVELVHADIGTIGLVDEISDKIWARMFYPDTTVKKYYHPKDRGITGWVANNKTCLNISDVHGELPAGCKYEQYCDETKSELAVPIFYQEKVIGVLNVESHEHYAFDEDDCRTLKCLAIFAAIAIENERFEHLKKLDERIDKIKNEKQGFKSITKQIIFAGVKLTGAEKGAIELISSPIGDTDEKKMLVAAIYPKKEKYYDPIDSKKGIVGGVVKNKKSILVPDVDKPDVTDDWVYEINWDKTKSELAVPIIDQGNLIGVINVESTKPNAFTLIDRDVLESFADYAATAIELARLSDGTSRQIKAIERLQKIGSQIAQNLKINRVLGEITKGLTEIVEADIPLIYLFDNGYDKEKGMPTGTVYGDISENWEKKCKPRNDGKGSGERALHDIKVIIAQEDGNPDINKFPKEKGVKTTVAIPLIQNNREGVMYLHFLGKQRNDLEEKIGELKEIGDEVAQIIKEIGKKGEIEKLKEMLAENIDKNLYDKIDKLSEPDIILIYSYDSIYNKIGDLCYGNVGKRWKDKDRPRVNGCGAKAVEKGCLIKAYEGTSPGINETHCEKGVKTTAAIPLMDGNTPIGIMYMHFLAKKHYFQEYEEKAIEAFATSAALAIKTAKSYEDLNTFYNMQRKMTGDLSYEEAMEDIIGDIEKVARGSSPKIFTYDKERKERWKFEISTDDPSFNSYKLSEIELELGYEVMNESEYKLQEVPKCPQANHTDAKTIYAFPLRFKDKIPGVLYLHYIGKHISLTEDTCLKVSMLADLAASVIENNKSRDDAEAFRNIAWLGISSYSWHHQMVQEIFALESLMLSLEEIVHQHNVGDEGTNKVSRELNDVKDNIKRIINNIKGIQLYSDKFYINVGFDIRNFIEKFLEDRYGEKLQARGLKYQNQIKSGLVVRCNPEVLKIVLDNLVDNVVLWASEGEVIFKGYEDNEDNFLRIEITNTGVIPEYVMQDILKRPILRGDGEQKGSGIGLLIVKAILERYGGHLELTSDTDTKETTFIISLPRTQGD